MSLNLSPVYPVIVTADWNTIANAVTDVEKSLETVLPVSFPMKLAIVVTIVEGDSDKDDVGRLSINTSNVGTWTNAFDSVPVVGETVFVVDIY
jgi:hypothetical protein